MQQQVNYKVVQRIGVGALLLMLLDHVAMVIGMAMDSMLRL